MTTSGRQDDSVKHFEPRDVLYLGVWEQWNRKPA
jgi:hypothetical protein